MTTSTAAAPRRGLLRRSADSGPRARLRDLLPYLAEHRGPIAAVVVLSIVGAALSLAQPLLVEQVVTRVQRAQPLGGVVGLVAAIVAVGAVISGVQHYLLQRTGTSVVLSARTRLIRHLLRLPVADFDRRRTGDLVARVGTDTTLLYAVLTQGLVDAVGGAFTFVGALVGMALLDPVLLGLTLLIVVFAIVVVGGLSRRIRVASRAQQDAVGALTADVERSISAVRTIRASGATDRETESVLAGARRAWTAGLGVARASAPVVPVASLTLNLAFLVVIGVGGFRVASGAIGIGSLVAFLLFLFLMVMPLGSAFGAASSVASALGALGRITEVLDLPAETATDAADQRLEPTRVQAPAVEFEGVSFSYRGADGERVDVLHDVSFTVPRGTRTALVGPSGAGKSTMLALLERFYDVDGGAVRVGGVDVKRLPRDVLRSQFGYVEQDAPALAGTIRDNLRLAAPLATDDDVLRALDAVNLRATVLKHPEGLDAEVGEEGVLLSGGERQRLAIARALLADAPILLLDESTSNLDGRNEQLLRDSLAAASEGRTTIVIAHRLSTVVDADQIVVVDGGRAVAAGRHEELLTTSPLYRELAATQLLV
ncbi:ABC transporter ATP-binding protein [Amnibacterium setariae]|uniref:ABC transporter ATP-binding protein n=1 Tax=Amnibacterium setariae TaxID=2306585 RepID=A0A3A1TWZ8_9MICO|nr:ABC transporter ATP-binding protein [Amnibacterium setariae]RIX26668.1 ABC transporter ATP-binding protein [Amnibacterium setariae]